MPLRLRQICLVAENLAATEDVFRKVFGLEVCHRDLAVGKWGLANFLNRVGTSFLEVVSPISNQNPGATAAGRYLKRRSGDGGYMVILQASEDEHAALCSRLETLNVRVAADLDYGDYRGVQLHPKDCGGAILSLDRNDLDKENPTADDQPWHPAGPNWKLAPQSALCDAFLGVELQSDALHELAARWARILNRRLEEPAHAPPFIELDNARIRFSEARDGRGEGLGGIDLASKNPEQLIENAKQHGLPVTHDEISLAGVRFKVSRQEGAPRKS